MIPIQCRTPDDCFRACIASVLECQYEQVPDFKAIDRNHVVVLNEWLEQRSFRCFVWACSELDGPYCPGYWIAEYRTPNGSHAVVMKDGEIVHDPSDDNDLQEFSGLYYIFHVLDPSK